MPQKKETKIKHLLNISLLSLKWFKQSVDKPMLIFNSFSVGFGSLCDLVVFVLCIFPFLKQKAFMSL